LLSRKGIVACFFVAALVAPAVAVASSSPSGTGSCGSACQQYTEIPATSGGPKAVGRLKTPAKLTKKSKKALASTNKQTRKRLTDIVNSFGAPNGETSTGAPAGKLDSSVGKSLGAAIVSLSAGSTARLVALLIAIVGTTATVGILAIRRQRVLP